MCIEKGVLSKSQLLQVARQPNEGKMKDLAQRFALGMVNREQARAERNPDKKPRPAVFRFVPPAKEFKMVLQFRKNRLSATKSSQPCDASSKRWKQRTKAQFSKLPSPMGRGCPAAGVVISRSRRVRGEFPR